MRTVVIINLALTAIGIATYFGYFFITPNLTVANNSKDQVSSIVVTLPNSRLDFGALNPGEKNTIYYSINQADGIYLTRMITADGKSLNSACGSVTNNEFGKRVTITLNDVSGLICEGA